ncbi:MAG: DUF4388 domain-containing protein [Thermodesulfobacteriota bacterium]|nr:DUF4388 domain-containing protein [Thermodesulfobacteriota bacterium]
MSLKGQLEAFYLASLLQLLSQESKTGVLQVSGGGHNVKVFVKDGLVVYASSSQKQHRLGHLLKAGGFISPEDLHKCLQLARKRKQKIGRVFVEEGLVSKKDLTKLLRRQVKEILNDMFFWKTGQFEFKEIPFSVEGQLITEINIMEIVLDASRRTDEWSVITKHITDDSLVFKPSAQGQRQEGVKLDKREWGVLSLIDGRRTVKQVVTESGLGEFVAYKTIYSLLLSGFVEKSAAGPEETGDLARYADMIGTYNDILRVVHTNLETELGKRVYTLFDKCKGELVPKQKKLLTHFDVKKDAKVNTEKVLEGMDGFKDYYEGRISLVHSFNSLLLGVLEKAADIVGARIIQRALEQTEQLLAYVKEFQNEATEKIKIVYEVENIFQQVRKGLSEKEKSKGRLW